MSLKKVYTSLDFGGNSTIEDVSRVDISAADDHIALEVRGWSIGGSANIAEFYADSGGVFASALDKDGVWHHYENQYWTMGFVSLGNHLTHLLSGVLDASVLYNTVVSGYFDCQSIVELTNLVDGSSAKSAVTVSQLLSAVSGVVTSSDDLFDQYIYKQPTSDSRNDIQVGNDVVALRLYGQEGGGGSSNIQEWLPFTGSPDYAYVDPTGLISGFGLDAQSNRVTQVDDATAADDAVNLNQMNVAISGHTAIASGIHGTTSAIVGTLDSQSLYNKELVAPVLSGAKGCYFEKTFTHTDFNTNVTGAALEHDGGATSSYYAPFARSVVLTDISVNILHIDGAPPSAWDCQIFKNGTKVASMQFAIGGSVLTNTITNGVPHPGRISFGATDGIGVAVSGAALDQYLVKVALGFETNE